YEVMRYLGEGGKKKVYLAHDSLLDRDVAFALIKTEGLDEVSRTRITQEAQAMGRLSYHPHIVTIFDLGEHDGQPYMVTELMGGGDLEGMLEDAPDHRLPLEQAIKIAVETCLGLEFVHAGNIIHRDLKPGNVWLTGGGTAKIGDFGLAVAIDKSGISGEGMIIGSAPYMPPEQATGGEVTPRADLYSLGAMLYHMVTGRPPFLGNNPRDIIDQHIDIHNSPKRPIELNRKCPEELSELIMSLLAKKPTERPKSATEVLAKLAKIEAIDPPNESVEDADPDKEPRRPGSLAGGVFVGRQKELTELKAALDGALTGQGRLVMLMGEPGIGKTRIAQELASYAETVGTQVLWGRCDEDAGAPPYWPWVQPIQSYIRQRDPASVRIEMGPGAADIAEVVAEVRDKLPDLETLPPLEPDQARFRLLNSITNFFKKTAESQPLMLVLEDLQWSDKPSLLLLGFLARQMAESRLLVVGTYRNVELFRQHPLSETLAQLSREPVFHREPLRGLNREETEHLIQMTGGIKPSPRLVETIYTRTEGNPFFMTEVVRLLSERGALTSEEISQTQATQIPESVLEVIGQRLNRLSDRCNQTLTTASVIGREFDFQLLSRLSGEGTEDWVLEDFEEALAARVIEESLGTTGRYRFAHALIQETLAQELSATRRERQHARIAEALELLYRNDKKAHVSELAHHFFEGQKYTDIKKVIEYSRLAGESDLDTFAYEGAARHFQNALRAKKIKPESPPYRNMAKDTAAILFGLGRAFSGMAEHEKAFSILKEVFKYYAGSDKSRAVEAALSIYPVPGSTRVLQLIKNALKLEPDWGDKGPLLCNLGRALSAENNKYKEATKAFNDALEIAEKSGDKDLEIRTLVYFASVHRVHLHFEEALDLIQKAIDRAFSSNDLQSKVVAYRTAASVAVATGNLELASEYSSELLESAEALRDRYFLAAASAANQLVSMLKGDWPQAREFSESGLLDAPKDPTLLGYRALLEYQTGNFDNGKLYLERLSGLPTTESNARNGVIAIVVPMTARIAGGQGPFKDALVKAQEAIDTLLKNKSAPPNSVQQAKAGLALLALLHNDVAKIMELYSPKDGEIQFYPGTMASLRIFQNDRLLGLLAAAAAKPAAEIDQHFEDAISFCTKAGYLPELAWTCLDYADALDQRDVSSDDERIKALLDQAGNISSDLHMVPLTKEVVRRKQLLSA
ncbi:MAG: protein kinase, partial [Dehalococcoidia bacterium]